MITQEELKRLLHYDKDTGVFIWKISRGLAKHGKDAGNIHPDGYIQIGLNGNRYCAHRLAWFYVYGVWPNKFIDHIDQNPSNNSINNLREATNSQNQQNYGKSKKNTSGFRGVSFNVAAKKWKADIAIPEKRIFLGYFETSELAHKAYKQA